MNTSVFTLFILLVIINLAISRDFYVGMFKKNDLLVAQDRLYKEMVPYKSIYAKYGRIFECKITYFRIVDRLGYGPGPKIEIIRGGLRYKYLVLRLTSPYNMPISVNIYVGCANTFKPTTRSVTNATNLSDSTADSVTSDDKNPDEAGADGVQTDATAAVEGDAAAEAPAAK